MFKECTFKDLPELLQERINGMNEVSMNLANESYNILRCEHQDNTHRCIIYHEGVFAIYDIDQDKINVTWLRRTELKAMNNTLKEELPCTN